MAIASFIFYVFAFLTVFAALMVIAVRNPVHAVLFLIFAFFNTAGLFVLLGAEYIAFTLVIVYVGAVAILFLFVVMMLNINFSEMKEGFLRYLPIGAGIALFLCMELYVAFKVSLLEPATRHPAANPIPPADTVTNTAAIGNILYTDYVFPFQLAGLILLIAMIGAIALTLRVRSDVRKQDISKQLARSRKETVELVNVKTRSGI